MGPLRRKAVVVGDGGLGETSLLYVFAKGSFPETWIPIVFDVYVADVTADGKDVELALWDTAGQEDYDRLRLLSYPDTHVILIYFAIDSIEALESVQDKWISEVHHFCQQLPIILVGCKAGLRYVVGGEKLAQTVVTPEQGEAMCKMIDAHKYLECSAKYNHGFSRVFEFATRAALYTKMPRHYIRPPICRILKASWPYYGAVTG